MSEKVTEKDSRPQVEFKQGISDSLLDPRNPLRFSTVISIRND